MISAWWLLTLLPAVWLGWKGGLLVGELRQSIKMQRYHQKVLLCLDNEKYDLVRKLLTHD
jgi:hypothetical protein